MEMEILNYPNVSCGSILDLRGLAIRSILPSDRDRPEVDLRAGDSCQGNQTLDDDMMMTQLELNRR